MNQTDVYESLAGIAGLPQSKFIREVYKRLVTPEEGATPQQEKQRLMS